MRVPSMPVNNKAMLQKLPLKVYRRLEEVVAGCPYLEWHHFDAGVIKVRQQGGQKRQHLRWLCRSMQGRAHRMQPLCCMSLWQPFSC